MNSKNSDKIFYFLFISIIVVSFFIVLLLLGLKSQAYNRRRAEDEKILRSVVSDVHVDESINLDGLSVVVAVNPDMTDTSKKARCLQIERGIKNALTEEGISLAGEKDIEKRVALTVYIDEDQDINSENIYAIYNGGFFSNELSNSHLADILERHSAAASGMNPAGIFDSDGNSKAIESCETPAALMLVSYPEDEDIKLTVNRLAKGMAQGIITAINNAYGDKQ